MGIRLKMVGMAEMQAPISLGMAEMGATISLDSMAVHPDCWCICLCYVHFAPRNPEDGEMYLLVPAHLGCPGQSPESCKIVVCVMFAI